MLAVVAVADEDTLGALKLNPVVGAAAEAGVKENPPTPLVDAEVAALPPNIDGTGAVRAAVDALAAG